jgi:hypothetical protein
MTKIIFDLDFLEKRLDKAKEPSRALDGDLWWIVDLNDDMRDHLIGPLRDTSHLIYCFQRDGSPGAGMSMLGDVFDKYEKYTSSIDAAMRLVNRKFPSEWPAILSAAISNLGRQNDWHMTFPKEGSLQTLPLEIMRVLVARLRARENPSSIFSLFDVNSLMPDGVAIPRGE